MWEFLQSVKFWIEFIPNLITCVWVIHNTYLKLKVKKVPCSYPTGNSDLFDQAPLLNEM